MTTEKIIMVRGARVVPVALLIAAILLSASRSPWWLLSIPFIWIGWICAAPNLNLANGLLAYLSMICGFVLMLFHEPSGAAIAGGAAASFYLCALEMRVTAKPYNPTDFPETKDKPNKPQHPTA
ncbi:hypothetical protein [Sulfuriroseicoccus oceanibius]|uniref:Uncharacterized protein n=1 Tax=Sulfuriroseicoccus oceanibius TaxID=2707525 RepID=A0A6B3L158_9BACT|nr:hypothetical protein [Sulfuriroseicoccus oceanibius]QQL44094.1 hypothetical protein G3M56_009325 [Sulfuriroseicoccus oceanibius]